MPSRLASALAVLAAAAAAAPSASLAAPRADPALKAYLAEMGVRMNAYHAALTRADHAFTLTSNRAAIAAFKARSAEFRTVAARIKPLKAPAGLAPSQTKIVRAISLVATAFKGFATARAQYVKKRNRNQLLLANTRQHDILRTAERLQVAWARAVRARTVKAGLVVPQWLRDFF